MKTGNQGTRCGPIPGSLHQLISPPGTPFLRSLLTLMPPVKVALSSWLKCCPCPQGLSPGRPSKHSSLWRTKPAPEQALHRQLLDDNGRVQRRRSPDEMQRKTQRDKYPLVWGCRPSLRVPTPDRHAPLPSGLRESPCPAEISATLPGSPGSASPSHPGLPSSGDNIQRPTSVQSLSSISSLAGEAGGMEGRVRPTLSHPLGPSLALGTLSQVLYPGRQRRGCWLAEAPMHWVQVEVRSNSRRQWEWVVLPRHPHVCTGQQVVGAPACSGGWVPGGVRDSEVQTQRGRSRLGSKEGSVHGLWATPGLAFWPETLCGK
uniref:uncharacterized protein LOC103790437 isoform X2 n=1 Tax=Callithrix jacchus TaxID=9483 RepID=UPI0023DD1503|nr:uncharacterized protein LOC103790437 isoform X2 [Callithrix jacchus]